MAPAKIKTEHGERQRSPPSPMPQNHHHQHQVPEAQMEDCPTPHHQAPEAHMQDYPAPQHHQAPDAPMHDAPSPTFNLGAPSSPALDLTTMDKHFNFTSFSPADLGAPVTAVLLCAHRDVRDGRPPKPRRPNDDDDYFYRYRGHHPLFDSDDEDFPMHAAEDGDADAPPPLMPNHWTMVLELASTDGSNNVPRGVKLDMAPGHQPTRPFREGTVLVSSLPLSSLATLEPIVKALRFLVPFATSITTVQHVLADIRDNARHRYVFSENGEGSRYWIREVVSDMVTADVLDDGAAARAEAAMAVLWGETGEEMAREKGLRRGLRRGMFTEWTIRGEKKKTWW